MSAMVAAVFLVFLLYQTNAEPDQVYYSCSDSSKVMTFNRSSDGVEGRYTAELCSLKNPNWTDWTIDLSYYDNPKYCNHSGVRRRKSHSTNTVNLNDTTNCTHVCYAMNFDLVFSSCYEVKSTFKKGSIGCAPTDSYHNITNNLTKAHFFQKETNVNFVNHDYDVSVTWLLGIPATDFKVEMCHIQNDTKSCVNTTDVTRNCSSVAQSGRRVECALAPPHACYRATLAHDAPWVVGLFSNQTYVTFDFCHHVATPPTVPVRGARVWWACGGALLAASALLAAAALQHTLSKRKLHKRIIDTWRRNREVEAPRAAAPGSRPVLLLYAREAEPGQAAVAALKDLLQKATGGLVYDLFSPEVMALCAPAPATWLRGMLERDDVRVLLLQTPAIAALYQAQLCERDKGLTLQEPLLGRRAMYRAPQFGDQLLQLALRHVAETAHAHHAYHKYYLATYAELETEVAQQLVPYRRYVLPGAARALLADLAPAAPAPADLRRLAAAAAALLRHVRDHPDYLVDELRLL